MDALQGVVREAFELFQTEFGPTPKEELHASVAPGRVNLIGDHVDYADGYVLPIVRFITFFSFYVGGGPPSPMHFLL